MVIASRRLIQLLPPQGEVDDGAGFLPIHFVLLARPFAASQEDQEFVFEPWHILQQRKENSSSAGASPGGSFSMKQQASPW